MSETRGLSDDLPCVVRSKKVHVSPCGPDTYRAVAQLSDTAHNTSSRGHADRTDEDPNRCAAGVIHDFGVEAMVQGPDLTVTKLEVWADAYPYRQCPAILTGCQVLVGKSLASGWRKAVLDTLGSTAGCTHMTTLLVGLAEVRTMVFFLQMNAAEAFNERTRADGSWTATALDLGLPIVNACHVLTEAGPVITAARGRGCPS
jgi:Protein of unknown function (DUF2889)